MHTFLDYSVAAARIRECKTEEERLEAIDYCLNTLGLPLHEIEEMFDWYHPTPKSEQSTVPSGCPASHVGTKIKQWCKSLLHGGRGRKSGLPN
ncbi:MAG: hypothetical protein ACYC35_22980 [Pirellulales bacterium]